jgi:hypothetical protein
MLMLCAALPLTAAFTPVALPTKTALRTAPLGVLQPRAALLTRHPPAAVRMAERAAALPSGPSWLSMARRATLVLLTFATALLWKVGRAFAASRSRSTALTVAGVPISGGVIKYGALAGLFSVAYLFRTEETPILTETPIPPEERAPTPPADAADDVATASNTDAPVSFDDSSLNSALLGRMQQLAAEKARAEEAPTEEPPVSDSTDSWGEGSTAVLEPPKPGDEPRGGGGGLLDGDSPVDFPAGFPLVEGEWEREPVKASDDQIAMLQRMFGETPKED